MGSFVEGLSPFVAGLTIGALLLVVGAGLGFLFGRRRRDDGEAVRVDNRRVLRLLKELGTWTQEYRGGVAKYQNQLTEISSAAKAKGIAGDTSHVMPMVEKIMETNQQLQARLEAAEKQLEQQTRQIESYLSEARTDGLTGLANRRAFDKKLDESFSAFRRGGHPFVLALLDIDHFKSINDTYGHPVGDIVLRQIAHRMSLGIEDPILVARFGGEEFAVLLPSPLRMAAARMDVFRKANAAEAIECDGQTLNVTFSVGLSETKNDVAIGTLVRRADEALYAAKGIGRNRTYYHDGEAPTLFGAPEVVKRP